MVGLTKMAMKIFAQLRLLVTNPRKSFENLYFTYNHDAYQQKLMKSLEIRRSANPIVVLNPALSSRPTLNVMLPSISRQGMTGGPNTAINLACQIAASGIPVRLVSVEHTLESDLSWFWNHMRLLTGNEMKNLEITLASSCDPDAPLPIGPNDIFLATYWTTADTISQCLGKTNCDEFIYLIQDFEPAFFPWSTNYALAINTYDLNFRAIINETTLADFLCESRTGRFAAPAFIKSCAIFEPAVDSKFFFNAVPNSSRPRRLLFYARPGRNMMAMGYDALRIATERPIFDGDWEFISIGAVDPADLDLSNGKRLRQAPWMTYADYAKLFRESDILLCLMFSPHTSYPPLEMVASGGIAVTNEFATKTRERLLEISPNFIAGKPNTQAIADCLIEAAQRVVDGYDRSAPFNMPRTWSDSLSKATEKVREIFLASAANIPAPAPTTSNEPVIG
jgi:hypothetical protein